MFSITVRIRFCHKQAAEQLCRVCFLHWPTNTKCVKAAGGRQEEGLGGWEQEKAQINLVCSQHSMALCHSKQPLSFKCIAPPESLETLEGRGEREREEIEGWAERSEFHCV